MSVGESRVYRLERPITRVAVGNPEVADYIMHRRNICRINHHGFNLLRKQISCRPKTTVSCLINRMILAAGDTAVSNNSIVIVQKDQESKAWLMLFGYSEY